MKFYRIIQNNLIILIPIPNKSVLIKYLKQKKIIYYNYTKTKLYKENCKPIKEIKKIVFIKKEKSVDTLFVFAKKEIFIKGR